MTLCLSSFIEFRPSIEMRFDSLASEKIGFYVYVLIDPISQRPFYIGKGMGNRVFSHVECAIKKDDSDLKLDKIRSIQKHNQKVEYCIIRHGLTEKEAFEIESSLIEFGNKFGLNLTNLVLGHNSSERGLMSTDDIIRTYNAKPLLELSDPVIIVNINKKYKRGLDSDSIYEATRKAWVIGESRRKSTKYALSEYSGIIIEVFEISQWFQVETPHNKRRSRWGFEGVVADKLIRDQYVNKSIAHTKKRGAANPIRYRL